MSASASIDLVEDGHPRRVTARPDGAGLDTLWHTCAAASSMFEDVAVVEAPAMRRHVEDSSVASLMRRALGDPTVRGMLRVTVDGTQSTGATELVIDSPPGKGEPTSEWTKRLFGRARVGIGLNGAQRWSEDLTRVFSEFMSPVWDHCEHGWVDLRLTLFIGNYGFTDGGPHRDIGHPERVIHLNLGPAPKTLYTWPPEAFAAATGGRDAVRLPPFPLESAQAATFGPYELCVLNASDVHLALNEEHSVSVAVEMIRRTPAEVLAEVSRRLAPATDRSADAPFLVANDDLGNLHQFLAGPDLGARYTEGLHDLAARNRSNGGFRGSPQPRTDVSPPGALRCRSGYALERGAGGVVYARGSALRLPGRETELESVAAAVEAPGAHTRSGIAESTGIDVGVVDQVVSALWRLGAIESAEPVAGAEVAS